MRIIVISDSHGSSSSVEEILDKHKSVREVIFLGDGIRDFRDFDILYPDRNFHLLVGNCDFCSGESEDFIEIAGKKIFMTHGHNYFVKYDYDYESVRQKGKDMGADIVLFGHTHQPFTDYRNYIHFMNPGSARDGRYGLIEITGEEVNCSLGRLQ